LTAATGGTSRVPVGDAAAGTANKHALSPAVWLADGVQIGWIYVQIGWILP
jgi:hypothetical protein